MALTDTITWTDFAQDYRSNWDYSAFGPFAFARDQYQRAVGWLAAEVKSWDQRTGRG
jgi:hypothetical protein